MSVFLEFIENINPFFTHESDIFGHHGTDSPHAEWLIVQQSLSTVNKKDKTLYPLTR